MKRTSTDFNNLATIFIVLKLTGNIDWSWWWVLSPLWIGILFYILVWSIIEMIRSKQRAKFSDE